jgi:outer membrane protein assembly factor BamB
VVYAGSLDGHVYALNAADGTKLWSYPTGGPVNSALQVASGVLYAGSDDGNLYALRT